MFLVFFCYYVSMFGVIYKNTEYYLLKDTLISFGLSFLEPFGICIFPGLFRIPSLSNPKKNRKTPYISYIDQDLNYSQKIAIENALSCENFFLIHGPFGTGKTRTLVELISQETRQGHKVLATAESNAAIDNILERLMENKKLTVLDEQEVYDKARQAIKELKEAI